MTLVSDVDEEKGEPDPDDNEGQTGEDAGEGWDRWLRSQGRSGQTCEDGKNSGWDNDSFEIAKGEEPERLDVVTEYIY